MGKLLFIACFSFFAHHAAHLGIPGGPSTSHCRDVVSFGAEIFPFALHCDLKKMSPNVGDTANSN